jgi:hypothetical protein
MLNPHVVALTGLEGSGKSTAAGFLVAQNGFRLEKFAGPLKDMLRAIGLQEDEIESPLKNQPCDALLGRTPRHAMQTLGTEWGRKCIDEDFWLSLWHTRVVDGRGRFVVVDDCRFPNEAQIIKDLGGVIVRIERPDRKHDAQAASHISEALLNELPYDFIVQNVGSPMDLYKQVYDCVFRT